MTETVELKPWPLGGYAPGDYSCVCGSCQKEFVGDKRAWQCLECAAISAKSALTRSDPAVRDRVKPLEWKPNSGVSLWTEELIFGVYYVLYDEADGWRAFRGQFLSSDTEVEIAFGSEAAVKAAAQADYERRIISALELGTTPVMDRVTDEMVEAAMSAFIAAVRQQDKEWTDDIDEEQLLTSPSGDWFAPFYPIRDALTAALRTSPPEPASGLPQDVIDLVIAARMVAFSDPTPETIRDLDKASEAFASRVPWDDEPETPAKEPQ